MVSPLRFAIYDKRQRHGFLFACLLFGPATQRAIDSAAEGDRPLLALNVRG